MFNKSTLGSANYTIIIFIILIFYLVGLGFLLNAIGKDISIEFTSEDFGGLSSEQDRFDFNYCNCGVLTCSEYKLIFGEEKMQAVMDCPEQDNNNGGFVFNIVRGVEMLPTWANTLFLFIPFALLVMCGILLWLHG